MNKKIIFIDLDRTFLIDKDIQTNTFIKEDLDYLIELEQLGHTIVFITGRSLLLSELVTNQFPKNNFYLVCFNGAHIQQYQNNVLKIIKSESFDKLEIKEVLNFIKHKATIKNVIQEQIDLILLNKVNNYISNEYKEKLDKFTKQNVEEKYYDNVLGLYVRLDNFRINKSTFLKEAKLKFNNYDFWFWTTIVDNETTLEIDLKSNNKVEAMLYLLNYLDIDIQDTIAFGDNINDKEMLRLANVSVAMKNGKQEVKEVAKFITDYDNNNSGVVKFLKEYFDKKI